MKRVHAGFLSMMLFAALVLSGCGSDTKTGSVPFAENMGSEESIQADSKSASVTEQPDESNENETANNQSSNQGSKVLIAYFSRVGNTDFPDGIDAISSASLMVKDNKMYGNTQYLAMLIQENTGGDLFLIETKEKYPADYDETEESGNKENSEETYKELAAHVENLEQYSTVFIGFPNWYYDMPRALYSFFEEHDFTGKKIIPFCTSGGSGFSGTISAMEKLEPGAEVESNGLSVSHSKISSYTSDDVKKWLTEIQFEK